MSLEQANHPENIHFDGRTWKRVLLRVDPVMFEFLTRKQRAAQLSSSLKVYIILKVIELFSKYNREMSATISLSFPISGAYIIFISLGLGAIFVSVM
jgi:hypothetical protein